MPRRCSRNWDTRWKPSQAAKRPSPIVNKSPVDLLILDMYMEPGMDGLDTYREALKLRPAQKAIITSGYAETQRVQEMQELGAGALHKEAFFHEYHRCRCSCGTRYEKEPHIM